MSVPLDFVGVYAIGVVAGWAACRAYSRAWLRHHRGEVDEVLDRWARRCDQERRP